MRLFFGAQIGCEVVIVDEHGEPFADALSGFPKVGGGAITASGTPGRVSVVGNVRVWGAAHTELIWMP